MTIAVSHSQFTAAVPTILDLEARMAFRKIPVWVREIITDVSQRTGLSIETLIGTDRSRKAVAARSEALYLIKTAKSPILDASPSFCQIATWFGREHSGIIYNVWIYAERNGLPCPSACDFFRNREAKRDRARRSFHRRKRGAK
jgi:hypothetical protein